MKFLSKIKTSHIAGKTFFVRIDANIKFISDTFRIEAVLPTLKYLLSKKAKIVIGSHRGRPLKSSDDESLAPIALLFSKYLKTEVDFISAYRIGALLKSAKSSSSRIIVLENLRFFKGEKKNDPLFARMLSSCADVFVNEAFPVSHRKNASVCAITSFLPSYAGLRFEEEIKYLSLLMRGSGSPFTLVLGGAKISDKVGVIDFLGKRADMILIGGGSANTFFAASGLPMNGSLFDEKSVPFAKKHLNEKKLFIPIDVKEKRGRILDIGKETQKKFAEIIKDSKTVVWNGPMGFFEEKIFSEGTRALWEAVYRKAEKDRTALIIVGGGETIASLSLIPRLKSRILKQKNIFLSTGGGAMLEYLSGKKLPGVEVLNKRRANNKF